MQILETGSAQDDAPRPYDAITFGDMCVDLIVSGEDVMSRFGQVEKLVDDYTLESGDVTDAFLASARHLHHGSFFLQTGLRPHVPQILARAKALGVSTSLDPNWDPDERWNSTLLNALPLIDIFFPNDQEALHISRRPNVQKAAAWLRARGATMVAIKRGADGTSLYCAQASYECPVAPVVGGDSIGAGDSFDAGFLAGWLRDLPLEQCLAIACRCGRAVASAVGGLAGQPSWARAKETVQP